MRTVASVGSDLADRIANASDRRAAADDPHFARSLSDDRAQRFRLLHKHPDARSAPPLAHAAKKHV